MVPLEFPHHLSDDAVLVRQLAESDAPAYAGAFTSDPDLGRLLGLPRDPSESWVRAAAGRAREAARQGRWLELVVCDARGGELIGGIGLTDWSARHRRCELGYWLVPAVRRRGLSVRASRLVLDWLFGACDLLRIEVTTTADNVASQRVALALGFTRETLRRSRDLERTRRVDVLQFGLLREEWPPRRR